MNIPRFLHAKYKQLSAGSNNNSNSNTNQVYNAMLRATKSYLNVLVCKSRCNVFRSLKKLKVGTSGVESLAKRLCIYRDGKEFKNTVKEKIIKIVISEKLNNAYAEYRASRYKDGQTWCECKRIIKGPVRERYVTEWRAYVQNVKRKLNSDELKKVEWLLSKWRRPSGVIPSEFEGITIKSEGEAEFPVEFSNDPRLYGGVVVSDNEKTALMLPPKFGLLEDVNVTKFQVQLEEAISKHRWSKIINTDDDHTHHINLFDIFSKTMDINTLKVTSLPFNPGVTMPWALKQEDEIRLAKFKSEVMSAVKQMKGRGKEWSNLSEVEKVGLASLRDKVKEKEVVCCVTDKSGRWACDTVQNYKDTCMDELRDKEKTPEISIKQHDEGERELNCHATAMLRMMGLKDGEGTPGERLRRAVQANGTSLAPFYGLRKDHKEVEAGREEKGPRVRPICGAEECSTRRVSYLLCQLLVPLIPRRSTQCESTDQLLREFEKVNARREADRRWIVGSLDVASLYPSLDIVVCGVIVARMLVESDLVFKGLCWREVALYLRFQMDPELLDVWTDLIDVSELSGWLPKRRCDRRPPKFEASGSDNDRCVRFEPWVFPEEVPEEEVVRNMFCIAIGVMVRRVMELHDFCIDGRIFRQKKGGSIGLDLTGVVSDVFMCGWDKMLLERMAGDGIDTVVYGRYKDDVNFVLDVDGEEAVVETGEDRDQRVMDRVKDLANGIHASIQVEVDCGYNHPERQGRLPILDVEVWIGEAEDRKVRILHSHYAKDVSSRLVMASRSAHGENTKRNVMVNEMCRIMKNCSVYLPWEEAAKKVSYYVKRMEYCGYSEEFRYAVVKMAVGRHRARVKRWKEEGSMYEDSRSDEERLISREEKRRNWYKDDGKYDSVLFVQATEGSELKKKVQRIAKNNGVRFKVVEKAGLTVKKVLQRSNPFGKRMCDRKECMVCKHGKPGECRTRGCGYQLMCKEDGRKYRGQTGRSVYERVKEEVRDWKAKSERSPLWRHSEMYHGGREFDLDVRVTDRSFGKPSRRMIAESVMIEQLGEQEMMNSKKEWTYVKLNKVHVG